MNSHRGDGLLAVETLLVGASTIDVELPRTPVQLTRQAVITWVRRAAQAVEAYYGKFPVPRLRLTIHGNSESGVHGGRASGARGEPQIVIGIGYRSTAAELAADWSLPHEMVHLAFPNVSPAHHWLEEGLASYVEPIARVRTHALKEEDVWREWIENMPQGQPEEGDRGLDHTPTWGRTYWGGALFCLVADVEIHKRSGGRHELGDALRAILAHGGDITTQWSIERALRVGDEATGTSVLQDVYGEWSDAPVTVDLPKLWRELGVRIESGEVRYDASAPLATIRRSLVVGRGGSKDLETGKGEGDTLP